MTGLLPAFLPGTDAYYLVEQVHSVLASGALKIHDGNPVPFLIAGISVLGLSVDVAFYVYFGLVYSVFSFLSVLLFERCNKKAWVLVPILQFLFLYQAFEFPKMGLATLVHFAGLVAYRRDRLKVAIVFTFGACLIHRAFVPMFVLNGLVAHGPSFEFPKTVRSLLVGIAVVAGALLLPYSGLGVLALRTNLSPFITLAVAFTWVGLMLAAIPTGNVDLRSKLIVWCVLGVGLFPSPVGETFGLGERLALLSTIVAIGHFAELSRGERKPERATVLAGVTAVVVAVWFSVFACLPQYPYSNLVKITDHLKGRGIRMLIAPRSLKFYYTAKTGRDAFFFDPDITWNKGEIWRVTQNIREEEYNYFLPPGCGWATGRIEKLSDANAVLIREDCWQQFRSLVSLEPSRDDLPDLYARTWDHEMNPSRKRPPFIRNLLSL